MSAKEIRWNAEETFKREAVIDKADSAPELRTVDLSFSSEMPVSRGPYDEVLLHDPAHMDLSRLNDSHPLLLNHDAEKQIGVIERARLCDDKKGRATVRFSKSQLGEEIWNDVKDGIRRLVSVGYRRTSEVSSEKTGDREVVRFAWQPYEISIVSIPADTSVGIGRNQDVKEVKTDKVTMDEIKSPPGIDYAKEAKEIVATAKALRGKVDNVDDLAQQALSEGKTLEQFRTMCLGKLPEIKPLEKPILHDVNPKDWRRYSLTRAICSQMPGGKLDGFEAEVHAELTSRLGQSAQGFWVPAEALSPPMGRTYIAGDTVLGGFIVSTPNLGSEFVDLLRSRIVVGQLGARMLQLTNPVTIPRQSGAGTANWINGETTAATLSAGNFTQLTLTPKGCGVFQQYSKQLLATSNPSIDNIVRDDITATIALAIDLAAIAGAGTSGAPTGVLATSGINTVAAATNGLDITGSTLTYPFLVSMESEIATDNADRGAMGWVMHSKERGKLKVTPKFASTGIACWEPGDTVLGYKVGITNQLSRVLTTGTATTICSYCVLGNWNDMLIGEFNGGATDLVVDPYTLAAYAVVRLLARHWVDVGVRHPASFCAGGGIIA